VGLGQIAIKKRGREKFLEARKKGGPVDRNRRNEIATKYLLEASFEWRFWEQNRLGRKKKHDRGWEQEIFPAKREEIIRLVEEREGGLN